MNGTAPEPSSAEAADAPATRAPLSFEGGTAFLVARAGAEARRRWARMLTDLSLTPHQHGVLMALAEVGPTGQQRLGELLGVDARNLVGVLDALVARDLVARGTDPSDRRRRVIALSPAGHHQVAELTRTGTALEADFLAGLTPDERDALHRTLLTLLATSTDFPSSRSTTGDDV